MQNGLILATLRTKYHLTLYQMACIAGISKTSYKLFENNIRPIPLIALNRISNYFFISLDYLLNLSTINHFERRKKIDYHHLSLSLKLIRKQHHITTKNLALEFKMDFKTIMSYEKNAYLTSTTYLYLFAKKFNISVDYLLGKSSKKKIL